MWAMAAYGLTKGNTRVKTARPHSKQNKPKEINEEVPFGSVSSNEKVTMGIIRVGGSREYE